MSYGPKNMVVIFLKLLSPLKMCMAYLQHLKDNDCLVGEDEKHSAIRFEILNICFYLELRDDPKF